MKSFDEYWNDQKKNGFVPIFSDVASNAFSAGQQSKQAEVDELRKRLNMYEREGYKLVPVEPAEEMYLAGFDAKTNGLNTIEIYKAMLGAVE